MLAAVAAPVAVAARAPPEAAAAQGSAVAARPRRAGWRRQRRRVSRCERRLLTTPAPDEDCDERPADQHHGADDEQHDGKGEQPIDLDASAGGGVDAGASVGVHHHDGPVSAPHIPGQCAGLRGCDLGDPERLVTRRGRDRRAVLTIVGDGRRRVVVVGHLVVGHRCEVRRDVRSGSDPGEELLTRGGRLQVQADRGEVSSLGEPAGVAGGASEVEAVGGDRRGGRRQVDLVGAEVAVVVARDAVGHGAGDAADEQGESDDGDDRTDHDGDDATGSHVKHPLIAAVDAPGVVRHAR